MKYLIALPFGLVGLALTLFFGGSMVLEFINYPVSILTVVLFPISLVWAGLQALVFEVYCFLAIAGVSALYAAFGLILNRED